jgi:choline kinase
MKAIMLAAGFADRLELAADAPPKILLRFGGKSLLQRHAEILKYLKFDELVLGVGNKADHIHREISDLGIGDFVRTVDCPQYATGAPYTLWGLRAEFDGPAVFMDGDVLYDQRLMARLCNSADETCFAMDRNIRPSDDPVKICFRDGEIVDFHKVPSAPHDEFAEWIGFLRLSAEMAGRVEGALTPYIEAGRTDFIYEQAFGDLLRASPPGTFAVADVTGLPWTEIDFPYDLEYARTEIFPRLEPLPS